MIIKDAQNVQIECDRHDCKNITGVYHRDDFSIMSADAKQDGWKIFKRGVWKHYCSWWCSRPEN